MKYSILSVSVFLSLSSSLFAQKQTTYCNPVNIDYRYTPIPDYTTAGKQRATADPVIK